MSSNVFAAPLRVSNLIVVLGRAGIAIGILAFAICVFATVSWAGVVVGAMVLLLDAAAWRWSLGNPLWIDVDHDGIRVRWLFSTHKYGWNGLKVFWMTDISTVRSIKLTHNFAHVRIAEGRWFKVRVSNSQIAAFDTLVPEACRGKAVISRVQLNG